MQNIKINIPLFLTLSRLVIAPIVVPILFLILLPENNLILNIIVTFVFVLFALTDYFDGYIARSYNLVSDLGRLLDPIADKIFINSCLITLLHLEKINLIAVLVFVIRENYISGLRLIALQNKFDIHVSSFGKVKTIFQVFMIFCVLLNINNYQFVVFTNAIIIIAILLSLFSAFMYTKEFIKNFRAL